MEQRSKMINSVLKAIKILNLFNTAEPRLSLAEISRRLGMPKSTAHNLVTTLLSAGYIEKVDGDEYALGTAPLSLTQNIRVCVEVRDPAAPLLRNLADSTRESVYLTVREQDTALYIYAIESPRRLMARSAVGEYSPLHCTSVGKAILAFLPEEEVNDIISREGLPAFTANTITDPNSLKEELIETRMRGYSVDRAEHELNTYCIGAPIFSRNGEVIGSCSISGTDPEITKSKLDTLSREVRITAQEISRRMGYVPASVSLIARLD